MVDLDNTKPASDLPRRPVDPNQSGDVHLLVYRGPEGEVDKVEQGANVGRLPRHVQVVVLMFSPGSAQGEGELRVLVCEREGDGRWGGDDVEELRDVGDL